MTRRESAPWVPVDLLDEGGWTLVEETTERVFTLPTATVDGHTRLYEDTELRRRIVEAGGDDRTWRFFFATRLRFRPPLTPGIAPLIKPTVVSEANRSFADDLRDRGFEAIDRSRSQKIRTESGRRARFTQYRGELHADDTELSVVGLLAVWYAGEFYVAGGGYPESGLERWVETEPTNYRDELLNLIRAVK